jgi:bifunctional ADP-heptose synthase (sugar kinase/adenylyltransferase)
MDTKGKHEKEDEVKEKAKKLEEEIKKLKYRLVTNSEKQLYKGAAFIVFQN